MWLPRTRRSSVNIPLVGSASGFANFGTQLSGVLNRGAGISGVFNTGGLNLITQSLISGYMNLDQRLSGLLFTGIGP